MFGEVPEGGHREPVSGLQPSVPAAPSTYIRTCHRKVRNSVRHGPPATANRPFADSHARFGIELTAAWSQPLCGGLGMEQTTIGRNELEPDDGLKQDKAGE